MNTTLELPERTSKPRDAGRTQILDKGMGPAQLSDQLEVARDYVDLVKFGWGTSVVTANLAEKIEIYRNNNIDVCFGGTLFELFYVQNRVEDYAAWLTDLGVGMVEISDGSLSMPERDKLSMIERFAREFTVYSEVGSKDETVVVSPAHWVAMIKAELAAGASYAILEGRESGTAGLYRPSGEIRMGLITDIVEADIGMERLVFEAPKKVQQVWLIKRLGSNVNLANIPLSEAVAVETLRLGLRADTLLHFHG